MGVRVDTVPERGPATVPGLGRALHRFRDPVLLFAAPVVFAALVVFGYVAPWPLGFDYRGTLWEPARAVLDGLPLYPEATRDAIVVGNPAVYPPPAVLATVPLAFLPVGVASAVWFVLLGACVLVALRLVGVRDWRCHVLALASPVVVHGLYFGNLSIALMLPVALAWRYREQAPTAGIALGAAVAAKLFVWPLVVWLLLTRRFRAAAWAAASSVVLLLCAWAVIGFEGLAEYPALLRAVQDVYAVRSLSLATVAAALGAPSAATAVSASAAIVFLALAAVLARRNDGDRRSFTVLVAACIVATPIVWPNYCALLFVPIAVTWPRLAPVWFFGYLVWFAGVVTPKPVPVDACCRPDGVTAQAWAWSHVPPSAWYAGATMAVVIGVLVATLISRVRRPDPARPATVPSR